MQEVQAATAGGSSRGGVGAVGMLARGRAVVLPFVTHCMSAHARFRRRLLAFRPEAVWEQSGLEVGTVAGFLHENALHFLTDDAVADAADVADCLGDVGARMPLLDVCV